MTKQEEKHDNIIRLDLSEPGVMTRLLSRIWIIVVPAALFVLDVYQKQLHVNETTGKEIVSLEEFGADVFTGDYLRFLPFLVGLAVFFAVYVFATIMYKEAFSSAKKGFWFFGGLLILLGSLSNLIDLIRFGGVVGYISIRGGSSLNISSLMTVFGLIILLFIVLSIDEKKTKK